MDDVPGLDRHDHARLEREPGGQLHLRCRPLHQAGDLFGTGEPRLAGAHDLGHRAVAVERQAVVARREPDGGHATHCRQAVENRALRLQQAGATVIGALLTRYKPETAGYGYGYGYGYGAYNYSSNEGRDREIRLIIGKQ